MMKMLVLWMMMVLVLWMIEMLELWREGWLLIVMLKDACTCNLACDIYR